MQTKATNSGTAEETAVKTLHVFIYDVASPHAPTIASFSTDANTLINSGNSWTASTPIRTLKADKYIFAGINLTPAISMKLPPEAWELSVIKNSNKVSPT